MAESAVDLAFELQLREMELIGSSATQTRTALATVLGLFLTADAVLIASALDRGVATGWIALTILGVLVPVIIGGIVLIPRSSLLTWPRGVDLIKQSSGSLLDEKRRLVVELDDDLVASRKGLDRLTRHALIVVFAGAASVGLAVWGSTREPRTTSSPSILMEQRGPTSTCFPSSSTTTPADSEPIDHCHEPRRRRSNRRSDP